MLPLPLLSLLAVWAPTPRHTGSPAAVSFARIQPVGLAARDDPPLPLPPDALLRLRASGIGALHPLQHAAHAAALRGLDVVVHAETGAGKTLCFALPTLARLAAAGGGAPRALVLAPTLELAAQTAHVFNSLRPGCAAALARGEESLPRAEVVVGPPAMLLALLRQPAAAGGGGGREEARVGGAGKVRLRSELISSVQVLVLDEADALLMPLGRYATSREKSSRETHPKEAATLTSLLCAARADELQVLACSATVGRPLRRELAALCARPLELIRAPPAAAPPAAHARAVGLPCGMEVRVLTHEQDNTIAAIHAALAASDASSPLLFLPPGRSVTAELKLLKQCGLNAVPLTDALLELRAAANALEAAPRGGGEPRLIVAASSEARGIDLPAVDLVLLVGVPPTADAFLHMAGRTARRGEAGEVVVLTTKSSAAQQLGVLGAQLGVDFERNVSHLDGLNQEWAQTWWVHQKVVGAEAKGWSG
ncbi:hypothetical protein AB1Y20_007081 [Prymnesium parvum]|uniref:RNA helicase n=1 Tax=Prymnesium parvum TaxID=97485 RepID=A0AB34J0W1_PRYPA